MISLRQIIQTVKDFEKTQEQVIATANVTRELLKVNGVVLDRLKKPQTITLEKTAR